jgi:hypothetical protein
MDFEKMIKVVTEMPFGFKETVSFSESRFINQEMSEALKKLTAKELEAFSLNLFRIGEIVKEAKKDNFHKIELHAFISFDMNGHNKVVDVEVQEREVYDNGEKKEHVRFSTKSSKKLNYNKTNKEYHEAIKNHAREIMANYELTNKEEFMSRLKELTGIEITD